VINLPTKLEEVQQLITDQVQEDIHLDYKDSRALVNGNNMNNSEIAKDISAFANSDGGILIYGVQEKDHLPVRVDDGVENTRVWRERLEQVINSNITRRIDDLRIKQIPVSADKSIYAVQVPKSYRAPHQEKNTKKYYKRFNFESVAMEDYEINDIRARRRTLTPLVNVDGELKHATVVYLRVSNIGDVPAEEVKFDFSQNLVWSGNKPPPGALSRGIKYLSPGKVFYFFYHTISELFADGSTIPSQFDVTVSYLHPEIGQRISDEFHLDFADYLHSHSVLSDINELAKTVKESIDALTGQVAKLHQNFEKLSTIASATGLDLSVTSLRNIRHILANEDQIEKIDPVYCELSVFEEVLGVDNRLASELRNFFLNLSRQKDGEKFSKEPKQRLAEIEGMTKKIAKKVRKHFRWEGDI